MYVLDIREFNPQCTPMESSFASHLMYTDGIKFASDFVCDAYVIEANDLALRGLQTNFDVCIAHHCHISQVYCRCCRLKRQIFAGNLTQWNLPVFIGIQVLH